MNGRDVTVDQRVRAPQAHRARVSDGGRTILDIPKVATFLDEMVAGEGYREAAARAGLRLNRARRLMSDPAVRREYHRRCDLLLESERARNMLVQATIRDRGLADSATAAQQKASLEATRLLQPSDPAGITVNGPMVIAGYVIKLPPPGDGPRRIGSQPPVSRDAEDV